jgi:hypothetical protein
VTLGLILAGALAGIGSIAGILFARKEIAQREKNPERYAVVRARKAISSVDDEDLLYGLQSFIGNRLEYLRRRDESSRRADTGASGTVSI